MTNAPQYVSPYRRNAMLAMLPESYLLAIGRVITQWSTLEEMVGATIWRAAALRNDYGRILMAQMQLPSKLDALGALVTQRRPALGAQFNRVADYVRECLQGQRNLVAHGMWITIPNAPFDIAGVVKLTARGKLVNQARAPMTIAELEELAGDIADVTCWILDAGDKLPASKQRPGGLGHTSPGPRNPQDCATRKSNALQPPTSRRKLAAPKPKKPPKPKRAPAAKSAV